MAIPLILQIQQAALDSNTPLTDALRKAKIACMKLGLTEFGEWVEHELNGYVDVPEPRFPEYRKLYGTPLWYNRFHGWRPIRFNSGQQQTKFSFAPLAMALSEIEDSLPKDRGNVKGEFQYPYPPELHAAMRALLNRADDFCIELDVPQIHGVINAVRNILLNWTVDMEKQGIFGADLMFSSDEREKSASATANTVNNINIGQVGSFVQNAQDSVVHGSVEAITTTNLSQPTLDLVQKVEALLPISNLPAEIHSQAQAALGELKQAASAATPESGRLRNGLETLKRVLAPAGETAIKIIVDAVVTKLLNPNPH